MGHDTRSRLASTVLTVCWISGCGNGDGRTEQLGTASQGISGGTSDAEPGAETSSADPQTSSGPAGTSDGADGGSTAAEDDGGWAFDVGSGPIDLGGGGNNDGSCRAPTPISCDGASTDPFHAMGLGCPDSIPISAQAFHASDATSWRVAKQYGTYTSGNVPIWGPREGEKFLFVSTGSIGAPNGAGVLTKSSGGFQEGKDNGNPDGQPLPGPIRAEYGSNSGAGGTPFIDCDAAGDCSDSLLQQWEIGDEEANDLLWFEFDITVPAGVHGYQFDFAWFSTEYPEWVSPEPYNDIAVWWASGETFTGNVTFVDDQPLTVTALAQAIHDQGFWGADPQLAGTGFDGVLQNSFPFSSACFPQDPFNDAQCPIGGGTGWYTASASAMPGETITMAFAIFDMGDSIYDTAMLLDNFQWDCEGCDPTLQECGVVPTPAG